MNKFTKFIVVFVFLIVAQPLKAQINNLVINGSSTHFTMMSGDLISWSYDLPVGGTANIEIWLDVNGNHILEPSTDVIWHAFSQTDGQFNNYGPPDMDGEVNGHIIFEANVGLAPTEYILLFTNNNATVSISGTVTPLISPALTISGTITVPPGKSAQYLVLNLEADGENNNGGFWTAISDINGYFEIQMNSDTTGNPWRLGIDNSYRISSSVQSPQSIYLTLDPGIATNYPGNNFEFIQAAAEVKGIITDENGNPKIGEDVFVSANMGAMNRFTRSILDGSYSIGFLSNELPLMNVWLGAGNTNDPSIVSAAKQIPIIDSGDVIIKNLKIYNVNSTISGVVTLNGVPPNMNLEIHAHVQDTAFVRTWTDLEGNYSLNVSNLLYNYVLNVVNLPSNYSQYSITAHPGQTNVNFNFTTTDIEPNSSTIPEQFALLQNFPNPFNPSTVIKWQTPIGSWQTLKIYDILGNEITTLINEYKPAGNHEITFDASNYPSGIYLYTLHAGNFVSTKLMLLLK